MGWLANTFAWLNAKRLAYKNRWDGKKHVIDSEFIEEHWWRKKRLYWKDVVEISASNEDMLAYTAIWLVIRDDKGQYVSIEELSPYFKPLNELLMAKYEKYPKTLRWMGEMEIGGVGYWQVLWSRSQDVVVEPST